MKCPSLILCICLKCGETHNRIDGRGVFGGRTVESHGFCDVHGAEAKAELMEQLEKED